MERISKNLHLLGHFGSPKIISVYLIDDRERVLIDPGPYCTASDVIGAIRQEGLRLGEISYLAITHFHMDHVGGAWAFIDKMPKAKVLIDEGAVKHIAEPSKLFASAHKVLGDILDWWGEMRPVPISRIKPVRDNDSIHIGDSSLKFISTLGHSPYHMSILEAKSRSIFTGDAVGIYSGKILWPASPLPSFRLDLAVQSIKKLRGLRAERLMLPHFGVRDDANALLQTNLHRYESWGRIIKDEVKEGHNNEQILARLRDEFPEYISIHDDKYAYKMFMIDIAGYVDYFQKQLENYHL